MGAGDDVPPTAAPSSAPHFPSYIGVPVASSRPCLPPRDAVVLAEQAEDASALLKALHSLVLALAGLEDGEEVREILEQEIALAEQEGNFEVVASAIGNLGVFRCEPGHLDSAADFRRAREIARQLGNVPSAVHWTINLGQVAFLRGDWDEAERVWRDAADTLCLAGRAGVVEPLLHYLELLRGDIGGADGG